MTLRSPLLLAAGLGLATSLLSTPGQSQPAKPSNPAPGPLVMQSTKSCDGLKDLMVDTAIYQMLVGYGYHGRYYGDVSLGAESAPSRAATTDAAGGGQSAGPSHHTTTNVQEQGVDEADTVKTDGKFVYAVHANQLVIAKTWPVAQTDVVARVTFKTIQPQQIYLRGNDVIVQGYASDTLEGWNQGRTRVMVVDVTNRKAPRIKRIMDVEGWSTSSRVVGDEMYLVQNTYPQLPPRLTEIAQKSIANIPRADQQSLRPWEIQSRLAATMKKSLLANITQKDIVSALPRVRSNGTTKQMACEDLYVPKNVSQMGMTTLAKISLTDNSSDLVGAMVSGGTVYASTDALYVAAGDYTWNQQGMASYGTQVHKFALGRGKIGRPAYVATGRVEGQLLNQFSMSEYKGDLRIATTDWMWNGQQGGNHLFVLRAQGRDLRTIGALKGLAKGERIFSGRMIGEKGYLVTFRQTDPLFTLDLRDPTNPRVVGELKVNGFSSYIHPMGDDLLLTIGQDADDSGRVTGVHLQVFDVKDPAHPTRKFHEKVATKGYSSSQAQYDHHAFMYDPITKTLAFPISEGDGSRYFNGLAVYSLDAKKGFKRKGKLDHATLADPVIAQMCKDQKQHNNYYCTDQYKMQARMGYGITRSMVVDKYILSLSALGLEIHELGDLDVAATLGWAKVEKASAIAIQ